MSPVVFDLLAAVGAFGLACVLCLLLLVWGACRLSAEADREAERLMAERVEVVPLEICERYREMREGV